MNITSSYILHIIVDWISNSRYRRLGNYIDKISGLEQETWSRVVMRADCYKLIRDLDVEKLKVLEISGRHYEKFNFKEYVSLSFPEFDICSTIIEDRFDLIIAEQVFEHLLWPYRAGKNVYQMLNPSGHFLISTPFLVRIHNAPTDCTRWTETGLKYFLAECGFSLDQTKTSSWGNRACVKACFLGWTRYRRRIHTLENEADFPYHVWGIAQK